MSSVIGSGVANPTDLLVQDVPKVNGKTDPDKAARQFEGMLMAQIFQTMRKTVDHSGLFGESAVARSTYEYLLDQAVVEHAISGGTGWGLAQRLAEQWKAKQNI
nr:rod-binding protein [uncultured Holophaga sp.]